MSEMDPFDATFPGRATPMPAPPASAPRAPTGPAPMPAAGSKAVEAARLSWTLGIVAVCLTMIGPCFYYLPMVIALPIAIIAVIQARTALAAADLPEASRIYGQTGLITSALALGWSLFVLVITVTVMVVYFGLILAYVGLILAMVGSGQFSP